MILLALLYVAGMGVVIGWTLRAIIADKEHDYRWWHEGCRHNIEERWRVKKGHRPYQRSS